jgi:probable F420-dependent oxidoreductase
MYHGLRLPNNGPNADAETVIAVGQLAEELGFDSVWSNDHIIMPADSPSTWPYERLFEPFITLAILSRVTRRIKLATGVIILPLREPLLVAKQAATLDAYSNGRLILGCGVGWELNEYRFLNAEFNRRGQRCDEWLEVIRQVWRGRDIHISTETYQISDGVSEPRPLQEDGIPILIGGSSQAALRRAALQGDGWIPNSSVSLEAIAHGINQIKSLAPPRHKGLVYAFRRPHGSFSNPETVGQFLGSLNRLHQIGVQGYVLALSEELPPDAFIREIRLFAEKVMPLL